jgi:hypothetical protein
MPYLPPMSLQIFVNGGKHFVSELVETNGLLPATVLDTGLQMLAVHLAAGSLWTQREAITR